MVALIVCILLMAGVPPVSRDALTHHLAVPRLWINHGGIYETPDIIASYYPMNIDLLYVLPLLCNNDILPKYIHFLFALATAGLIYGYLRRRLGGPYGLAGALLFLSLPIIVKLSITVYVDLGLIFFSTAALLSLIVWKNGGFRTGPLLLAALCCGLALGTKYNALVIFILLGLFVPYIRIRQNDAAPDRKARSQALRHALGSFVLFGTVALVVYAPWGLRNLLWTGNPFFPLFDALFNPQDPFVETTLHPFAIRRLVYQETLGEIILVPLRIFWQGQDDMPALFDGRLNPGLLLLPLGILLRPGRSAGPLTFERRLWFIFALLFILIVLFTRDMRIRYIAPALPPLVILAIFGLHGLLDRIGRMSSPLAAKTGRITTLAVFAALLLMNAGYMAGLFVKVAPAAYLQGEMTREAYIERFRPEYAAIQFANRNMQPDERVLCLFLGNRRYYLEAPNTFWEWPQFQRAVEGVPHPQTLVDRLRVLGITHVLMGKDMLQGWAARTMTDPDRRKIQALLADYLDLLFEKGGYSLYRLKEGPENPSLRPDHDRDS